MESGYTRKQHEAINAKAKAERRTQDRLRRVESKAPAGQLLSAPTPRKRGKSVATIAKELEAQRNQMKRQGVQHAVEHMDDAITWLRGAMSLKQPWLSDGTKRKNGDVELFFRLLALLRDFTVARAPFQTPKLSAVAVMTQPQQGTGDKVTTMTVNIFNQRGDKVAEEQGNVLNLRANDEEDAA
jgi:hypothetical protein